MAAGPLEDLRLRPSIHQPAAGRCAIEKETGKPAAPVAAWPGAMPMLCVFATRWNSTRLSVMICWPLSRSPAAVRPVA